MNFMKICRIRSSPKRKSALCRFNLPSSIYLKIKISSKIVSNQQIMSPETTALIFLHFRLPSRTLIAMQDRSNLLFNPSPWLVLARLRNRAKDFWKSRNISNSLSILHFLRSIHNRRLGQLLVEDYAGSVGSAVTPTRHSRIVEFDTLLESLCTA